MPSIKWALVCVLESVCLSHCWTKCDCLLSMDGNFLIATHCQMLIALDPNEFLAAKKDAWSLSKVVRTHGSEFRHDWWRVHQVKIEINHFWQNSNIELNQIGYRTGMIIVPKQFLIPIKRESHFLEQLLLQLSSVLVEMTQQFPN